MHHLLWRQSLQWIERAVTGLVRGVTERLRSLAAHRQIKLGNGLSFADRAKGGGPGASPRNRRLASHGQARAGAGAGAGAVAGLGGVGSGVGGEGGTLELVYLAPSAVHGFREPYVTLPRSLAARATATRVFKGAGFKVLDSTAMEIARPEMSGDGLHYNDAANYMQAQVLLNMLCNPVA